MIGSGGRIEFEKLSSRERPRISASCHKFPTIQDLTAKLVFIYATPHNPVSSRPFHSTQPSMACARVPPAWQSFLGDGAELGLSDAGDMDLGIEGYSVHEEDDCGSVPPQCDELPDSHDVRLADAWSGEEKSMDHVDPMSPLGVGCGLRQGWDDMPRGCVYSEVPIYSINSPTPGDCEAAVVLAAAFQTCVESPFPSLAQALTGIAERSNFQVVEVVRVQNISRAGMHDAFKRVYSIDNTRTVYHGTSGASATTISKTGFRGACSQRSKFGKGIYTSSNIWEALAYAEPAPDLTQTFLVVNLLQGPTTLGQVEMVDFGCDAAGNQILTATNPENTIFCASHGDQLLATYRISVRFDSATKHTPAQQNLIRMYHPTIWDVIKKQTLPPPPTPPLFQLPNPTTTSTVANATTHTYEKLQKHRGVSVGDKVKIKNSFKSHLFCDGHEGIVRAIIKDGHVHYCIQVCVYNAALMSQIERANAQKFVYPGQEKTWVLCKFVQVERLPAAPATVVSATTSAPVASAAATPTSATDVACSCKHGMDDDQLADLLSDNATARNGTKRQRL